ncbi:MAG: SGNH/GDSL hydrolase family protein [Desulfuromonadaceae bacterium]|nr:SGNH/GDSL hydrolase family protein [Desulfuromonadaceae bacterium]
MEVYDNEDYSTRCNWYASWRVSQHDYNEMPAPEILALGFPAPTPMSFENQTLRQTFRLSAGGDCVRIKLSNLFGAEPVTFSGVRIAKSLGNGAIDPDSDSYVTFNGECVLVLAAGAERWSDSVPLPTMKNMDLVVSIYFAENTKVATSHSPSRQTNYVTYGNTLSTATAAGAHTLESYYWLAGADVFSRQKINVFVAFGDSITDGFCSTVDANRRYPDLLDEMLQSAGTLGRVSVVNSGISGNRWLRDGVGPNGSGRFERDALDVACVTHVAILLGINDLGVGVWIPAQGVTAGQITAALATAIAAAKSKGLNVLVGTLTPYAGCGYDSAAGEASRQTVNAWIRTNTAIDAVIDFDLALRDPDNPTQLLAAYDSGDRLHPSDAGYLQMARTAAAALSKANL